MVTGALPSDQRPLRVGSKQGASNMQGQIAKSLEAFLEGRSSDFARLPKNSVFWASNEMGISGGTLEAPFPRAADLAL